MSGLKHIQVVASLVFDDGNVVTFSTPVYNKDIRHGDFFDDDEARQVLMNSGIGFATMVSDKSLKGLHGSALAHEYEKRESRKPKVGDQFSDN